MSWLHQIIDRINDEAAIVTNPRFRDCGTRLDLRSLPSPNLVIKVDALLQHEVFGNWLHDNDDNELSHCDYIAFSEYASNPVILMIEAKRGDYDINYYSKHAYNQLLVSYDILSNVIDGCSLSLPYKALREYDVRATCVMEALRGNVSQIREQRSFRIEYYRRTRTPLTYASADKDVWKQIRDNRR